MYMQMIFDAILKISDDPSLYIYNEVYKISTWIAVCSNSYYVLNLDFYKFSKNCKKTRFVNEHFYNSTTYIILRNRFLPGLFILYLIKNAETKIKQRVNITQTYLKVQGHNINFKDFL